jgi:hypothetical protein
MNLSCIIVTTNMYSMRLKHPEPISNFTRVIQTLAPSIVFNKTTILLMAGSAGGGVQVADSYNYRLLLCIRSVVIRGNLSAP